MDDQPLETAVDWKARALAAQRVAEAMRQKAQALKDSANQAAQGARDLAASLQRARAEILILQTQQKELARRNAELEEANATSQRDRASAQSALSSVQQQLALYVAALEESRQGSDLEQIRSALRSVLAEPTAEEVLRDELRQAGEENHGLRLAFERAQAEMATLESELRAKDEMLRDKEHDYLAIYGELDLTKSLLEDMRLSANSSERFQKELQLSQERLRKRDAAIQTLEFEMRNLLQDQQTLSGEHERETEALKATVADLEDQISDLEIVNSDLYQRVAELEGDAG